MAGNKQAPSARPGSLVSRIKARIKPYVIGGMARFGWVRDWEVAELRAVKSRLSKIVHTRSEETADLIRRNKVLIRRLEQAREEFGELRQAHQDARSQLTSTEGELAATLGQLDETRGNLTQALAELDETQDELAKTLSHLEHSQADLAQALSEREKARGEIETVRASLSSLQSEHKSATSELKKLRPLPARVSLLEAREERAAETFVKYKELKAKHLDLHTQLGETRQSLKDALHQLAQEPKRQAELKKLADALQKNGANVDKYVTGLRNDLARLEERSARQKHLLSVADRTNEALSVVRSLSKQMTGAATLLGSLDEARARDEDAIRSIVDRERALMSAMRRAELSEAQHAGALRAAAATFRTQRDAQGLRLEEAALAAEVARLIEQARTSGHNVAVEFDPSSLLDELRRGAVSISAVGLEDVLAYAAPLDERVAVIGSDTETRGVMALLGDDTTAAKATLLASPESLATDAAFDVVICATAFENAEAPLEHLAALARATAPGGRIALVGALTGDQSDETWRRYGDQDAWAAPPQLIEAAFPDWRVLRMLLAGPGAHLGVEIQDPHILSLMRPSLPHSTSLLIPPFMRTVAVLLRPAFEHSTEIVDGDDSV